MLKISVFCKNFQFFDSLRKFFNGVTRDNVIIVFYAVFYPSGQNIRACFAVYQGTFRPIFIKNGTYQITKLHIFCFKVPIRTLFSQECMKLIWNDVFTTFETIWDQVPGYTSRKFEILNFQSGVLCSDP